MAAVPSFTLNDKTKMPAVGLGCWLAGDTADVEEMCKTAIKVGYRHIDTAAGYGNEELVGKAIRESSIPRSEFYLTTKLWNRAHHCVQEAFEQSLKNLNVGYIDMYLMHWPQSIIDDRVLPFQEHPNFVDTWKDMEKLLQTGKVKSIGVSNFSIKNLELLLPHCTVVPATNQVQVNPCLPQIELVEYCHAKGIRVSAYSPFGQGNPYFFKDPDFARIAEAHKTTVGQLAVSWLVQREIPVLAKSSNQQRMKSNLELVKLTPDEMETINNLHKKPRMHRSLSSGPGGVPGQAFGWTYEQLGWPLDEHEMVIQ